MPIKWRWKKNIGSFRLGTQCTLGEKKIIDKENPQRRSGTGLLRVFGHPILKTTFWAFWGRNWVKRVFLHPTLARVGEGK